MSEDQTIDGVTFKCVQYGQYRAYADSTYEYEAQSERPANEVEAVMCEHAYKCSLKTDVWRAENRESPSMSNHFRSHYEFQPRGDGKYFYRVTSPYTD